VLSLTRLGYFLELGGELEGSTERPFERGKINFMRYNLIL
jgi:hypothetical protein